jgi:hypothetical protein
LELAAQARCTLSNPEQPKTLSRLTRLETTTIVDHAQVDQAGLSRRSVDQSEFHADMGGPGVLDDVRQ